GADRNYVETVRSPEGYALSEFSNGKRSGWMYTVNGSHPGFGLAEWELHDGDTVIWHYVNDFSYEVSDWIGEARWPSLGDGSYYDRWLKAPDTYLGRGGGLGLKDNDGGSDGGEETSDGKTAVTVTADTKDGNAGAEIGAETISEALTSAAGKTPTVAVDAGDAKSVTADLDAAAVKTAAGSGEGLTFDTGKASVTLDARALKAASEADGDITVSVIYNEDGSTVFDVRSGGESIGAKLRIELPSDDENGVPVIVNADGTCRVIKKSFAESGRCFAEIPAGSAVRFEKRETKFDDVKDDDRFAGDVSFVAGRGIFNGVSETEFAPTMPMNRAMLAAVLYRLEDAAAAGGNPFEDVPEGKWYTDAVAWASDAGIVKGTGAGFEPEKNIKREQLAAMLHRYVSYLGLEPGGTADLSLFDDGGDISGWARDDVAWAVGAGLLSGDGGRLEPRGDVTRAEAAEILTRLIKLIVG
ncbi:MAG: S-layer homology domain-containing protein, partial [Oscillospiraceae bacterium]|nr:S-layer homology domain-containing protein [Oscillospiraceae bacterium]